MSLTDKIRDKKQNKIYAAELEASGISLSSISYKSSGLKDSRIFLCIVRALLLFFTSFGTIGSVVSAFDAPFKPLIVMIFALVICFLIAFIYYNKITFYVGYILFFIFFSIGIFSLYIYVNSGFQAFINIVYEKYSDYFKLTSLREATEIVTNRQLTITIAMIFMIAFLSLLLNITISGYMSLIETFLITFPLLQIPLYIGITPDLIYLIMVLGSYITITVLGRSSHHKLPDIGKKTTEFINSGKVKKRYHSYISDGQSMLINTIYGILVSALFLLFSSFFLFSNQETIITNKLKATTDEYIKSYLQNGVWGLFDRYNAKGGLSNGKLGGVSSIHPDFQTDLVVTFVPEVINSVYLKSYIGTQYIGNSFITTQEDIYKGSISSPDIFGKTETFPYNEYSSKMHISNIDANPTQYYMPYYSGEITDSHETSDSLDYDVNYSPYRDMDINIEPVNKPTEEYEEFVYNTYLSIPENLKLTLNDTLLEANINPDDYINATEEDKKYQALVAARKIKGFINQNFSYTMAPGSTPPTKDFVDYFLKTQRRGFCAHFASASTMLLRSMGIPARYVEGYMISTSDISNAEAVSADISGWVKNQDNLEIKDTAVVKLEVNDSSAHAWTEIYLNGYGWIPYDFTPPSSDDDIISNFDFSAILGGLLLSAPNNDQNNTTEDIQPNKPKFSFNFGHTFGYTLIPILIAVCAVLIIIFIYYASPYIYANLNRQSAFKKANYSTALRISYILLLKELFKRNKQNRNITVKEFIKYVNSLNYDDEHPDSVLLSESLDRALYSPNEIDLDIYNMCIQNLELIKKTALKKNKN